jgi:hypothetical protein
VRQKIISLAMRTRVGSHKKERPSQRFDDAFVLVLSERWEISGLGPLISRRQEHAALAL